MQRKSLLRTWLEKERILYCSYYTHTCHMRSLPFSELWTISYIHNSNWFHTFSSEKHKQITLELIFLEIYTRLECASIFAPLCRLWWRILVHRKGILNNFLIRMVNYRILHRVSGWNLVTFYSLSSLQSGIVMHNFPICMTLEARFILRY